MGVDGGDDELVEGEFGEDAAGAAGLVGVGDEDGVVEAGVFADEPDLEGGSVGVYVDVVVVGEVDDPV